MDAQHQHQRSLPNIRHQHWHAWLKSQRVCKEIILRYHHSSSLVVIVFCVSTQMWKTVQIIQILVRVSYTSWSFHSRQFQVSSGLPTGLKQIILEAADWPNIKKLTPGPPRRGGGRGVSRQPHFRFVVSFFPCLFCSVYILGELSPYFI